ncbi:MAG: hypothetical protein U0271_01380 [Polyangiaceae bacterium]
MFAPVGLPGRLSNRSWLHPLARLSAIESVGFTWNPTAGHLPLPNEDDRLYVHVVVAGRAVLLPTGEILEPGQALVARSFREASEVQALAFAGEHRALALRLDASLVGFDALGTLSLPLAPVEELHARITQTHSDEEAERGLIEVLSLLHAAGLAASSDSLDLLDAQVEARAIDAHVADALSHALTVVERPMLVDVSAGAPDYCERHLRRRLNEFLQHLSMPFASWRALRQSFCLTTAALSMSLPGVKTETVSQATGFSSPTALCHALQRSALLSPQQLARSAAELRRTL